MKNKRLMALLICLTLMLTSISVPVEVLAAGVTAPQSFTLNVKSKLTMYVGMSGKIKVQSVKPKGSTKKVAFESSNEEVVKVTAGGTMKAVEEGTATIKVTSATDSSVFKEVKVTVRKLVKNKTYNKMVIVLDKKKKTKKLSPSSKVKFSNLSLSSNKKKVATVSSNGVMKGKKVGTAKITIKGKKGNVKKAKQVISLYVAQKSVKAVALDKESVTLKPGEPVTLTTTVTPEGAANVVVYSTSDEKVAKVDQNGKVTAQKDGTAKITATTVDGGKKAVCTVTVSNKKNTTGTDETSGTAGENAGNTDKGGTAGDTGNIEKPTVPMDSKVPYKPSTATKPIELTDLEANYPVEPNYPGVQLPSSDMQVNLKEDLLSLDVAAGTIVETKGYYAVGDGGQACYEIMTYDDWWNQLPIELKLVWYESNGLGNTYLYKNPVDNYGNHKLNNGMVAKLLPNKDGYVRVQQWGLFQNRTDNNRALIHIFANNHQNSRILFEKDAVYTLYYDNKTQAYQNKIGVKKNVPEGYNLDRFGGNGNEYALLLHCRSTSKPALGDAQDVELCGNGCTLKIPDNGFCTGPTDDFATIQLGGNVDGLKIHGFVFDTNGLNQFQYYDEATGTYKDMITRNHTIVYFSGGINVLANEVIKDGNGEQVLGDTKWTALTGYTGETKAIFNNVEIYGNTFLANGTTLPIKDAGGDDILLINPIESNNVSIHNNKMYDWGRWAFAIDLGGDGERYYNYSFKQNICIQTKPNVAYKKNETTGEVEPTTLLRGLGWIDFEARKCFTNLDVSENYVEGAYGWAFNGNGKISENVTINANHIVKGATWKDHAWMGRYDYAIYFYCAYTKGLKFTNNNMERGIDSIYFGGLSYDMLIENNQLDTGQVSLTRPIGQLIVRNNKSFGDRGWTYWLSAPGDLPWIEDENTEYYIPPEKRETTVLFEGNDAGGVSGDIIMEDGVDDYRRNMSMIFKNNRFMKFNLNVIGIKEYDVTADQMLNEDFTDYYWAARGCKKSSPVVPKNKDNPIPGGLYYKAGDLVTSSLSSKVSFSKPYYYTNLFPDLKDSNGNIRTDCDVYCTKEGVFPINGKGGNCSEDIYFTAKANYQKGAFVYTADNLYYVKTAGTAGETAPTHTSGTVACGTAEFMWVAPIARFEMREK